MECVLKTAPTSSPVTLEEVKALVGLETDQSQFDALLESLIDAAVDVFENETNTVVMEQSWYGYLGDWPEEDDFIEIWKPPLISVTSIKYTTSDGTEETWAATEYVVDSKVTPGRVYLGYLKTFPTSTLQPSGKAIEIDYKAGYSKSGNVPYNIKNVLKLLTEYWFTNRGTDAGKIPESIMNQIRKHKVYYL